MDGLDFFQKFSGLQAINAVPDGHGICPSCHRERPLVIKRSLRVCVACAAIKTAYPHQDNQFTLGSGDYALITEATTTFFSNLSLPLAEGVRRQAGLKAEGVTQLMSEVVLNPPRTDFMLIHFGKPTNVKRLRVCAPADDLYYVSGDGLIIDRRLIVLLRTRYPTITAKEWLKLIDVRTEIRRSRTGKAALAKYRQYSEDQPGIFDTLPTPRSLELRILGGI